MSRSRPIVVDLFAGAGGLSFGFEQAGFDVVAAVEIDPVHACVHKFNFPHCAVLPRSVREISGRDIREAAGLEANTPIDVVAGGAPLSRIFDYWASNLGRSSKLFGQRVYSIGKRATAVAFFV